MLLKALLARDHDLGNVRWDALELTDSEWDAVELRMDRDGIVYVEPAEVIDDIANWRRWAFFNRLERILMAPQGATTGAIMKEARGVTLKSVAQALQAFAHLDLGSIGYDAFCEQTARRGVTAGMSGGEEWQPFEPSKAEFLATARAHGLLQDVSATPLPMPPPTKIQYRWGDATHVADHPTIIAHIVDTTGAWGKGFTSSISAQWSEPEDRYRYWHKSKNGFSLGEVQLVQAADGLWIANMLAQKGRRRKSPADAPLVKYDALEHCLSAVAELAVEHEATLQMPRIGTGIAGGSWGDIEPLVSAIADRVQTIVFDFA